MHSAKRFITLVIQGKDNLLKLAEIFLSIIVFVGTVYFGAVTLFDLLQRDWSSVITIYDCINTVLVVLLGFEVARFILVHSISVVMELMLLVIARKMLDPDIQAIDLVYCVVAFVIVVGVYYLYEQKPLKSLNDLTK